MYALGMWPVTSALVVGSPWSIKQYLGSKFFPGMGYGWHLLHVFWGLDYCSRFPAGSLHTASHYQLFVQASARVFALNLLLPFNLLLKKLFWLLEA